MKAVGDEAYTYCRKEGDVLIDTSLGTTPNSGSLISEKSITTKKIYELTRGGVTLQTFLEADPCLQHLQLFEKVQKFLQPSPPIRNLVVKNLFGPTGSGKSQTAREEALALDGRPPFIVEQGPDGRLYFDEYDRHNTIILDDFRPDRVPFALLLRLLDVYSLNLVCRYSNRPAHYTRVYITTPKPLVEMMACPAEDVTQLSRRIHETIRHTPRK